MSMKKISIYLLGLFIFGNCIAQNQDQVLQKIENAKIALITKRLDLTSEQAQQFWPIYNDFYDQQKAIRSTYLEAKKGVDPRTASDDQNKQLLALGLKIKEQQLQLEKDYSTRMLNVITSRQMIELRKAESDFRKMLIDRVRNNNQNRQNQKQRLKNEERVRQQRNN